MKLKYNIVFFLLVACFGSIKAQLTMVLNGGIINISNGAELVVNESLNDAIIRISGHIISEGENNRVIWNTGTSVGSYIVPFGYGATDYIPVSFYKTAGTGSGSLEFSTYRTATWLNSNDLPTGVGHLNTPGGMNNSAYVIDRFWQMNAVNYSVKPDFSNVTFTYVDVEHTVASNTITESNLKAQRWNDVSSSWGDFGPSGSVDIVANTVLVSNIPGSDLYKWWTLVDESSPLPVEFLNVKADCEEGWVSIEWNVASEINNDFFSIERRNANSNWETIEIVAGAGNSSQITNYTAFDRDPIPGVSYYRIKQTDFNGKESYLTQFVSECENQSSFLASVFPNPSEGVFTLEVSSVREKMENTLFVITDMYGKKIKESILKKTNQVIDLSSYPKGVYILRIFTNDFKGEIVKKLVVE